MPVQTRRLECLPSLGVTMLRGAVRRRRGPVALPEQALRVDDVAVDRERLARYQRQCGFPMNDLLPQTLPHLVGFPLHVTLLADPAFPLPVLGLVHLTNTITAHRALGAHKTLDISVRAAHLRAHPKGGFVDIETTVVVAGERVWEGVSTYLARGGGEPRARYDSGPAAPDGIPATQWRLPADLGRRYAAVSGDANPIHLSAPTARRLGFPRAIAHGMWSYACVLAALGRPAAYAGSSRVDFHKPILLPGTVGLVARHDPDRTGCSLRLGTPRQAARAPRADRELTPERRWLPIRAILAMVGWRAGGCPRRALAQPARVRRMKSAYQSKDVRGVRARVSKSMCTRPKRLV